MLYYPIFHSTDFRYDILFYFRFFCSFAMLSRISYIPIFLLLSFYFHIFVISAALLRYTILSIQLPRFFCPFSFPSTKYIPTTPNSQLVFSFFLDYIFSIVLLRYSIGLMSYAILSHISALLPRFPHISTYSISMFSDYFRPTLCSSILSSSTFLAFYLSISTYSYIFSFFPSISGDYVFVFFCYAVL